MKKESVLMTSIFGSTFTVSRAEVEKALTTLNEPTINHLQRVRRRNNSDVGVVITGRVQELYRLGFKSEGRGELTGAYTVVSGPGAGQTYDTVAGLLRAWEPVH